jgi:hypothetical protein
VVREHAGGDSVPVFLSCLLRRRATEPAHDDPHYGLPGGVLACAVGDAMTGHGQPITAEFIGGPRDGQVMELPDLRSTWLFPAPAPPPTFTVQPYELYPMTTLEVMVYEVILDPEMGRPSLSDDGRYRYRYAGIR